VELDELDKALSSKEEVEGGGEAQEVKGLGKRV